MSSRDLYIVRVTLGGVVFVESVLAIYYLIFTGNVPLSIHAMYVMTVIAIGVTWWQERLKRFEESLPKL